MNAPNNSTPQFAAYILSCPDRAAECAATVSDLRRTDWIDEPVVIVDRSDFADRRMRIVANAKRLLAEATRCPHWTYLLFLEDDVRFNIHLRHNLVNWWPIENGSLRFGSLYNPGVRFLAQGPACAAADPDAVYGSQAFLMNRPCVRHMLTHYDDNADAMDIKLRILGSQLGPIYYHVPSLVQHVGKHSVWGGGFHDAPDFDAEFRA